MRHLGRRLLWELVRRLPRRELVLATANGRLAASNKDRVIAKRLFVAGAYESAEIEHAVERLRSLGWLPPERPVLADVGANLGMIAIAMLLRGHFREAIAFEPFPESFARLVGNARRNGLEGRLRAESLALSSSEGTVELALSPDNSGDHRIEAPAAGAGGFGEQRRRRVAARATTFDAWLQEAGVAAERIGLIWLDVQGHEAHFLRGAERALATGIPVVAEVWPYALERSGAGVAEFLRRAEESFAGFDDGSGVGEPRPIAALPGSMAELRDKRAMRQVLLLPR